MQDNSTERAYDAHPLAALVPEASDEEMRMLAADILANGLRHPVVIYENKILDGRHRYEACRIVGALCRFKDFSGDDPAAFVVSMNLARRHLKESQRAMVGERLRGTKHGGDRKTDQEANLPLDRKAAAEAVNASPKTLQYAGKVIELATPAVIAAVDAGEVKVSDAAAVVDEAEDVQAAAVAKHKAGGCKGTLRKAVSLVKQDRAKEVALTSAPPEDGKVWAGSCLNLRSHVDAASLDAIFTDPPYTRATLGAYDELARFALHGLKPGGLLLAEIGHAFLPECLASLSVDGLRYRWQVALLLPRQKVGVPNARVNASWRPFLAFERTGGKLDAPWAADVFHAPPIEREAKNSHSWGKHPSLYEAMAKIWLQEGWHVADPFCGTGGMLVAAKRAGCTVVGCDTDPAHVATARRALG